MSESPRPIRFVMDHRIFRSPFVGWLFRHVKAIPIAPAHEDAELLEQAYDACGRALADGELVCIFPEGKLTRTGDINPFQARHLGDSRAAVGARRADGAARAVGQRVLAPRGHALAAPDPARRDEPA